LPSEPGRVAVPQADRASFADNVGPAGPSDTKTQLWLVAATTLRNLLLITVAMLRIFVLLPALLGAQWASVG
jgi:hypothetical protein